MVSELSTLKTRAMNQNQVVGTMVLYVLDLRERMARAGIEVPPVPEELRNLGQE